MRICEEERLFSIRIFPVGVTLTTLPIMPEHFEQFIFIVTKRKAINRKVSRLFFARFGKGDSKI